MEINLNEVRIKTFLESLRPEDKEIRKQIDFGYTWERNTAILTEIRPSWVDPNQIINRGFAKLKYVKTSGEWQLFWMPANGKWESYQPFPKSMNLEHLLEVIKADRLGCFFG